MDDFQVQKLTKDILVLLNQALNIAESTLLKPLDNTVMDEIDYQTLSRSLGGTVTEDNVSLYKAGPITGKRMINALQREGIPAVLVKNDMDSTTYVMLARNKTPEAEEIFQKLLEKSIVGEESRHNFIENTKNDPTVIYKNLSKAEVEMVRQNLAGRDARFCVTSKTDPETLQDVYTIHAAAKSAPIVDKAVMLAMGTKAIIGPTAMNTVIEAKENAFTSLVMKDNAYVVDATRNDPIVFGKENGVVFAVRDGKRTDITSEKDPEFKVKVYDIVSSMKRPLTKDANELRKENIKKEITANIFTREEIAAALLSIARDDAQNGATLQGQQYALRIMALRVPGLSGDSMASDLASFNTKISFQGTMATEASIEDRRLYEEYMNLNLSVDEDKSVLSYSQNLYNSFIGSRKELAAVQTREEETQKTQPEYDRDDRNQNGIPDEDEKIF